MSNPATEKPQWYHIVGKEWGVEDDQPVWADRIYAVDRGFLHGRLIRLSLRDKVVAEFPASKVYRWYVSDERWRWL